MLFYSTGDSLIESGFYTEICESLHLLALEYLCICVRTGFLSPESGQNWICLLKKQIQQSTTLLQQGLLTWEYARYAKIEVDHLQEIN